MIGAKGSVKRTDKGELSVYVKSWAMLSKSVLPLPDKFHGLKDTEKRYRQVNIRYSSRSTPEYHVLYLLFGAVYPFIVFPRARARVCVNACSADPLMAPAMQ